MIILPLPEHHRRTSGRIELTPRVVVGTGTDFALPGAVCPISRSDLSVQSGSPSVEHQSSSHGRPETRIKQVAQYLHCSGSWYELSRDIQYVSRNIRIVIVRSVQTITACKLVNWHLSRRESEYSAVNCLMLRYCDVPHGTAWYIVVLSRFDL